MVFVNYEKKLMVNHLLNAFILTSLESISMLRDNEMNFI